ncbi:hypothetical protein AKJ09_00921 [Labilithrix luteola]|uniref:Uncharacterized protein n=1 Tax=Labilithrix luteola TaxID=1391654 RepID=A0A0K1PL68_9BACT|nr:hypothetical protein AKJ09_00921 [Labilithrix luteola]
MPFVRAHRDARHVEDRQGKDERPSPRKAGPPSLFERSGAW